MTEPRTPIDLPDDFGLDAETDGDGVIVLLALALFLAIVLAGAFLLWSLVSP
jgi:hypothetical protein